MRAADDPHLLDARRQRPLAGFELENHSAGNFMVPNQVFHFFAGDRFQDLLCRRARPATSVR